MASLNEFASALRLRDLLEELIKRTFEQKYPPPRLASVKSIDIANWVCTVQYPGETNQVTVKMDIVQPTKIDQVVRVGGARDDRYITEVYGRDPLHYVAATGEPAFQNSWGNYDVINGTPGAHINARFMKDALGFVHIDGLVAGGTPGVIFTVPAGYRPVGQTIRNAMSTNTGGARVNVAANGDVTLTSYYGTGSNVFVSLDGIIFYGEQ